MANMVIRLMIQTHTCIALYIVTKTTFVTIKPIYGPSKLDQQAPTVESKWEEICIPDLQCFCSLKSAKHASLQLWQKDVKICSIVSFLHAKKHVVGG